MGYLSWVLRSAGIHRELLAVLPAVIFGLCVFRGLMACVIWAFRGIAGSQRKGNRPEMGLCSSGLEYSLAVLLGFTRLEVESFPSPTGMLQKHLRATLWVFSRGFECVLVGSFDQRINPVEPLEPIRIRGVQWWDRKGIG
ncbi:hypothetical protein L1987_09589 [Smallanthus sonchifolius]|uniref:Uncharacterized protein n=1 Tax=Smallanthus sonchifolius TaxID=185202 RepID=A0ACB9JNC2_9ASTR|nr:hypothetical protein L1987_09589 [Smallanthus sonchifolius]